MNANIYNLLFSRFSSTLDRPCIETESGRVYTYGDLERETARLARFFVDLGMKRGERIAVQVEKSPEALFLYLAAVRAGLVYLPLNTAYQRAEMEYFMRDAEPGLVVCAPAARDTVEPLAHAAGARHVHTLDENGGGTLIEASRAVPAEFETVPVETDELAALLYTSGTTGRSKGAMLTHGNLSSNALTLYDYWGFGPTDVLLHALPIFHVHGLFVASNLALLSTGKMIFLRKFDAKQVLQHLPRATVFMGVPTYYTRLLSEPGLNAEVCRNMRLFISGSAPLLKETFAEFRRRTGHTILERYGMSETNMNTSNPLNGERVAGTVGLPLPGVEVRVVDDNNRPVSTGTIGNIQVKGPNVFKGYWRMPEKTREEFTPDGWFKTGDMGYFDAKGYLSIVGRSKDLVITGGYNVYPKEIETLIDEMPEVVESAVIGVPHPDFGEAVTAVVVKRPDATLDEPTVIARLKGQIANYKVPKRVYFVDDLPRNTMGKVQKNVLRERYRNG
ncbi:MAG TPA: malonyl-CoA synthase [Burkholderiales bacterium]